MQPLGFRKILKETDSNDEPTKYVKKVKAYKKSARQRIKKFIKRILRGLNDD